MHRKIPLLSASVLLTLATCLHAADKEPPALTPREKESMALADTIDKLIAARWKSNKITPAAATDDAEFLRRVYLDLSGRIPSIVDVSDFLADKDKEKRLHLVQRLIGSDRYAAHQAVLWRAIILAKATNPQGLNAPAFHSYLVGQFKERAGFDKVVRAIIAGGAGSSFQQANNNKMEDVAAATSRVFLGVKIECAQCHNHPFASWKRAQFWEFAAFFSGSETGQSTGKPPAVTIPGTDTKVGARFLDGSEPVWDRNLNRRQVLANWLTSKDNPWFARAIANRVWETFMGTGLVDPVDDFNADNEPSHPELLDELARQFAEHDFDVTYLTRAIVLSKTYQLTSVQSDESQQDPRLFARMAVRGMSAQQLFDSLMLATGQRDDQARIPQFDAFGSSQLPESDLLSRFPDQDRRTETQTSILLALSFMNGKVIADATSPSKNKNLKRIAEAAQSVSRERRVAELYMISLSRKPTDEETKRCVDYIEKAAKKGNEKEAYSDIFWALLNSGEFFLNH